MIDYLTELLSQHPDIYKEFTRINNARLELFARKHFDYGIKNIYDSATDTKKDALYKCIIRLSDKLARVKSILVSDSIANSDETLQDTLIDISNYATIMQILEKGAWR